jgi:hypothetical protein
MSAKYDAISVALRIKTVEHVGSYITAFWDVTPCTQFIGVAVML